MIKFKDFRIDPNSGLVGNFIKEDLGIKRHTRGTCAHNNIQVTMQQVGSLQAEGKCFKKLILEYLNLDVPSSF